MIVCHFVTRTCAHAVYVSVILTSKECTWLIFFVSAFRDKINEEFKQFKTVDDPEKVEEVSIILYIWFCITCNLATKLFIHVKQYTKIMFTNKTIYFIKTVRHIHSTMMPHFNHIYPQLLFAANEIEKELRTRVVQAEFVPERGTFRMLISLTIHLQWWWPALCTTFICFNSHKNTYSQTILCYIYLCIHNYIPKHELSNEMKILNYSNLPLHKFLGF